MVIVALKDHKGDFVGWFAEGGIAGAVTLETGLGSILCSNCVDLKDG